MSRFPRYISRYIAESRLPLGHVVYNTKIDRKKTVHVHSAHAAHECAARESKEKTNTECILAVIRDAGSTSQHCLVGLLVRLGILLRSVIHTAESDFAASLTP